MKKRLIYTLFIIAICLTIAVTLFIKGRTRTLDEYNAIDSLSEIKVYKSDITIEVINDRETNKYEGFQTYKKDIGYKLDLKDKRSFTFKGDEILVKDKENIKEYTLDKGFDEVFKYGFIGEYIGLIYTNEELEFETETINNSEYFVITTVIPGSNNNICKGSLYYDIKNNRPKKIIIYDNKGRERIIYTYENFNWTDKVEDVELDL
ncbi:MULTISPECIES: germination lipoprotein GerS-related protein [Clostridium]|uniref:germination lipoprotein GerS-related protein n=1 Tax=Clostridium TaxID=1485 RepID=UPI000691976C|nr:germination lipoprotein GerS-related protein [Clostridium sulfidigenes]